MAAFDAQCCIAAWIPTPSVEMEGRRFIYIYICIIIYIYVYIYGLCIPMRSCFLMTHIYWFHCQWHYGIFLFLVYICWLYYHCTHHSGLPTRSTDPLESALSIRVVFTFGRPEQLFLDICMCIYIHIIH